MTRRTWNVAWLVVALIIGGLVAARYARVFGLLGILASVLIAVVVVLAILRAIGPRWVTGSRPPEPPPDPRNVTSSEPPISTRSTPAALEIVDHRPGQRIAETLSPPIRRDEDRPDPTDGTVGRGDPRSDDPPVVFRDEQVARRKLDRPRQEDRPIAPLALPDHLRRGFDVGGGHRSDQGAGY